MPALAQSKNAAAFEVVRTEGCRVFAADGRGAIDFLIGWCVGNFGWGRPEIKKALRDFDGPAYVYPNHDYAPWDELARALVRPPAGLSGCFRATGGSEAVDLALQAAMLHTGRSTFLSLEGCLPRRHASPRSIGAAETRRQFPRQGLPAPRTKAPARRDAARAAIEPALKPNDIAAFILEPIICNLGALRARPAFIPEVQDLCRRYGTLLVPDEVATGFGRTGTPSSRPSKRHPARHPGPGQGDHRRLRADGRAP